MASQGKGCILEYYLPKGQTVNNIVYSEFLAKKKLSQIFVPKGVVCGAKVFSHSIAVMMVPCIRYWKRMFN
ncbi:hypothetical protein LAZ67_5002655 [Cordylochernes scorpioides]|uniref:Uncharacterized protein n=1 Tax=Cordylochernes scorpioides TaxID=51811 RepID=A0ABY6KJI1_9ARAC|nr:hypothetical protein LAZ67_5002655 [Cordylochernes scorpioides]